MRPSDDIVAVHKKQKNKNLKKKTNAFYLLHSFEFSSIWMDGWMDGLIAITLSSALIVVDI